MSIESMSIALHHSKATGTAKVVLLGIANHDGDGGAWPSKATLMHYAGVDQRNVDRAILKLVTLREIRVEDRAGGKPNTPDYLRPNLYHFLLECPAYCDRSRQHRDTRKGARYVPRTLDLLEGIDLPANTPPPGGYAARPPAQAPGDPRAGTPGELNQEPATNLPSPYEGDVRARAGSKAEADRSAAVPQSPSQRDRNAEALDLWKRCPRASDGQHGFDGPDSWCRYCGQAREDGSLYDRHGAPLPPAPNSKASKEAARAVAS